MAVARFAGTNLEPFAIRGLQRQQQLGTPFPQSMANFVGVQPAPTYINKTAAEKLAEEYREQNQPQGTRTTEEATRAQAKASIVRTMRLGQNPQPLIQDARAKGLITGRDVQEMQKAAKRAPLEAIVRSLPVSQALNVYAAASPAERQQIQLLVRKQVMNARNKPYEWTPKAIGQANTFFGIMPRPAALLQAHVPAFGRGGVVKKPTLALIGEREPEAVIPVRKLTATQAGRKIFRTVRQGGMLALPGGQASGTTQVETGWGGSKPPNAVPANPFQ